MACQKEVILGGYGHRVAHKSRRVDEQSTSHGSGDTIPAYPSQFEVIAKGRICLFLSPIMNHESKGIENAVGRYENCCAAKEVTNISGSFCISMTAAMGIPKFEAGPQKSVTSKRS